MNVDDKQESRNVERRVEPHSGRREGDIEVSREPVLADGSSEKIDLDGDRRRQERRKIDRMATGI